MCSKTEWSPGRGRALPKREGRALVQSQGMGGKQEWDVAQKVWKSQAKPAGCVGLGLEGGAWQELPLQASLAEPLMEREWSGVNRTFALSACCPASSCPLLLLIGSVFVTDDCHLLPQTLHHWPLWQPPACLSACFSMLLSLLSQTVSAAFLLLLSIFDTLPSSPLWLFLKDHICYQNHLCNSSSGSAVLISAFQESQFWMSSYLLNYFKLVFHHPPDFNMPNPNWILIFHFKPYPFLLILTFLSSLTNFLSWNHSQFRTGWQALWPTSQ